MTFGFCIWDIPAFLLLVLVVVGWLFLRNRHKKEYKACQDTLCSYEESAKAKATEEKGEEATEAKRDFSDFE